MRRHTGVIVAGLIALCSMLLPAAASATPPTGITGTAKNFDSPTHEAILGAQVCAYKGGGGSCTSTSSGGQYTLELAEGEYNVEFTGRVCTETVSEFVCKNTYVKQSQMVKVTTGNMVELNFELLEVDGKISGRVTSGGAPVENIEVCAFESVSKVVLGCHTTNANGEYTIKELPPGSYKVEFSSLAPPSCKGLSCQPANYITQYWNGQLALEAATTVVVKESETTTAVNAELPPGGHISGRVTNASIYAQPIVGVHVCSRPTKTNKEGEREGARECAYTNSNGEYTIQALASGGYEVEFTGKVCVESGGAVKCTHPYIAQFYPSIVSVSAPGTTSGINESLLEVSHTKPTNTGAPALTGTAAVGKVLNCSTGSWANNPASLTYRWLRSGVAIAGQTANTYTVQSADAGHGIACEVTASNAAGSAASTSNTVQIPKPAPGLAVFQSASVKGATVSITLRCTGANACSGVLKILTKVTTGHGRHKKARNVMAGLASFSMALGKHLTLRVHLTSQGRKLLGQAGKKGLEVQIAGNGVRAHTVVLRAPSKRRG